MDVGRFHEPQMRLVCGSAGAERVQQHQSGSGGKTAKQGTTAHCRHIENGRHGNTPFDIMHHPVR